MLLSLFLSTPSARRATAHRKQPVFCYIISIHALREEGDLAQAQGAAVRFISIHALREEGDARLRSLWSLVLTISIHALREEGDERAGG